MTGIYTDIRFVAICVLLALSGANGNVWAATSRTLDILPDDVVAPSINTFEMERRLPLERKRDSAALPPSGNPLWSVPLSTLSATRDRPVFSASRRAPPQAVAAPLVATVVAPPPAPPMAPEPVNLILVGTVVGENDAMAIFIDRANQGVVRMRAGESHGAWTLSSIVGREATLRNQDRTEVLGLVKPGEPVPSAPALPAMPAQVPGTSAAMVYGSTFAPFVPRSTPKDGRSDGL